MWNLTSPITGAAQTGFTTPTYTFVASIAPELNGKQVAITALGGTQTGVTTHTASSPFTLNWVIPKSMKMLGVPNPVTGRYSQVPSNTYALITRKGVVPAANQPAKPCVVRTFIEVPAGSDTYDAANVRAAICAHIGALNQQAAGIGDTMVTGV